MSGAALAALMAGAMAGCGTFLLAAAVRGVPRRRLPAPSPGQGGGAGRGARMARELAGPRGVLALCAGLAALIATGWAVAGAGVALLVLGWRGLGGARSERAEMLRLEALAAWAESLRDTVAGAVGLEQAIPASARAVSPAMRPCLERLVDRLLARTPMTDALRHFADELDDPGADLIVAALIINARLRGPGLRDLLGALARSVRDEVDVRRRVHAERRSTRRGAQIVVGVSAGLALMLAVFDRGYVRVYDSAAGQLVLLVVVGLYAAGMVWMRRLARFDPPARLIGAAEGAAEAAGPAAGTAAERPGTRDGLAGRAEGPPRSRFAARGGGR